MPPGKAEHHGMLLQEKLGWRFPVKWFHSRYLQEKLGWRFPVNHSHSRLLQEN